MGKIKIYKGFYPYDGNLAQAIQLRYKKDDSVYDSVTTLYERDGSLWTDYTNNMLIESREISQEQEDKSQDVNLEQKKLTDFFGGKLRNMTIEVAFQDER